MFSSWVLTDNFPNIPQNPLPYGRGFFCLLFLDHRAIDGYNVRVILMVTVIDIPDQFLGTNRSTQTAAGTLGIINGRQVVFHSDGALRANLFTDPAANAAHRTGTHGNRSAGSRCAGDRHIAAGFYRNDQLSGADLGADHASDAKILINYRNTVLDRQCAMLAGFYTGAIAKTAILADHWAIATNSGSS